MASYASRAGCPGATRALTTTVVSGERVLDAASTVGASMPVTVMEGLFQMRPRMDPVPIGCTPSGSPASARRVCSVYCGVSASCVRSPGTATDPSSSHMVDSSRMVAIIESGTAPPNMPECDAWSRVRTVSVKRALPRSDTVRAGVSASQFPESATTITSPRRASALSCRNLAKEREPYSSSPSTKSETPRSKSSPSASRSARRAAMCTITPALSSAAPRP